MSVAGADSKVRSLASPGGSAAEYIARRRSHALYGARHAVVLRQHHVPGIQSHAGVPPLPSSSSKLPGGTKPRQVRASWLLPTADSTLASRTKPKMPTPITPSIGDVHEGEMAGSQPPRWMSPSATKATMGRSAPAIPRGGR